MQFELILMECKDVTSVMAESTFIKEKRRVPLIHIGTALTEKY